MRPPQGSALTWSILLAALVCGLLFAALPTPRTTVHRTVTVEALAADVTPATGTPTPSAPAPSTTPRPATTTAAAVRTTDRSPAAAQSYARTYMASRYHWGAGQFTCLLHVWIRESQWQWWAARNGTEHAYGIPQANPGSKMRTAGPDWRTNPRTQVRWGLGYIEARYGTPCGAAAFWRTHHWY